MLKYYKALDGVRAVAISLVLLQHYAYIVGKQINAGFLGVDLFFVLSGFLITGILFFSKEHFGSAYKKFLGRRALRIFPLYYGSLLILYLLNTPGIRPWITYLLSYTFNYATVYFDIPMYPIIHFWSLGIEEQFYIFWPFVVLLLRNQLKWLLALMLGLAVLCIVHLQFHIFKAIEPYDYVSLFPRIYSLIVGGLGALIFSNRTLPQKLKGKLPEILMWAGLIVCMVIRSNMKMILFPPLALMFIIKARDGLFYWNDVNVLMNNSRFGYIGRISYGMYIFHYPLAYYLSIYVFNPLWNLIPFNSIDGLGFLYYQSWILRLPLYTISVIILAHLSYRYLEAPVLALKNRYFA